MTGMIGDMEIIITDRITKTVRARKHKKRRIDKKWLKRYGHKEVPDDNTVYRMGNTLYMTQKAYDRIKRTIES